MVHMERVVTMDMTRITTKGIKGTRPKGKVMDMERQQKVAKTTVGILGTLGITKALQVMRLGTRKEWMDLAKAKKQGIWQVWKPRGKKPPRLLAKVEAMEVGDTIVR